MSRGNALAKHAIYSGRNRASEFALCVHFEKLIPFHSCTFTMQQPKGECYCVFNGIAEDTLAPRKRIETSCNEQNWHQRWLRRCNTAATDLFREAAKIRPVLNPGWAFNMWLGEVSGMRILVSLPHDKTEEVLEWLDEELRYVNRIVQPIYGVEYMLNHSMKPASWRVAEIRAIGLR